MPEHVHLLISEPEEGTPSTVMQVLKQRVSRQLRSESGRAATPLDTDFENRDHELDQFWERRFYDFNVWSAAKKNEKLEYMHLNPVKRMLVEHPERWPWSSYAAYALTASLIPIDFVD